MQTTIIPPLRRPFGSPRAVACARRIGRCLLLGLTAACLLGITVGSAAARGIPARVQAIQALAVLLTAHSAHREPQAGSPQVAFVPANRPITGEQTTLPVIGHSTGLDGARWLQVMLPGRPDGSTGWPRISTQAHRRRSMQAPPTDDCKPGRLSQLVDAGYTASSTCPCAEP